MDRMINELVETNKGKGFLLDSEGGIITQVEYEYFVYQKFTITSSLDGRIDKIPGTKSLSGSLTFLGKVPGMLLGSYQLTPQDAPSFNIIIDKQQLGSTSVHFVRGSG
jgi:hypothetical protein